MCTHGIIVNYKYKYGTLTSPAMNCPSPLGNAIVAMIKTTTAGYTKRLQQNINCIIKSIWPSLTIFTVLSRLLLITDKILLTVIVTNNEIT